jgi:DNA-binding NarL/FixJ family response regulator
VERAKVMIVDDHPLFRQGLRRALEREKSLEMAGEAADGMEAIRMALEIKPQLILMDINLPSLNGLQVTKELKEALADTAVIMLTAYHDEEQLIHAMKAGARAYFPKEVTPQRLIWAIKEVMKGNHVIGDKALTESEVNTWLASQMEKLTVGSTEEAQFIPLSPREMEILQHAARGESNKEIARALEISQQTVKNHISSILRKLPARDRTEAAIYALRHGWIRLVDTKRED